MVHSHRKRRKRQRVLAEAAAAAGCEGWDGPVPIFRALGCSWRYGKPRGWSSEQGLIFAVFQGGHCVVCTQSGVPLQALSSAKAVSAYRAQLAMIVQSASPPCLYVAFKDGADFDQAFATLHSTGATVRELPYRDFWLLQSELPFPTDPPPAAKRAQLQSSPEPIPFNEHSGGQSSPGLTEGDQREGSEPSSEEAMPSAEDSGSSGELKELAAQLQQLMKAQEKLDTRLQCLMRSQTISNAAIAAVIVALSSASADFPVTYSVLHEDGDFDPAVPAALIRLCPQRPPTWGKGKERGHDLVPPGACAPGEGLYIGAPVVARWVAYQDDDRMKGTKRDAWFAGTIISAPRPRGWSRGFVSQRAPGELK
eukprot:Hpha_TRINITY_DN16175_c1_g1::TRINITY_DN16175_c1_g1_i1::g.6793::m.6793